MSTSYVLDLHCDLCSRHDPGLQLVGGAVPPSVREIRAQARRQRWTRTGRKDVCPACSGRDPDYWRADPLEGYALGE